MIYSDNHNYAKYKQRIFSFALSCLVNDTYAKVQIQYAWVYNMTEDQFGS